MLNVQNAPNVQTPNHPINLSQNYKFCSNENEVCNPGPGFYSVAYASDKGNIYYRPSGSGSVPCNSSFFGDPDKSSSKSCWVSKIPNNIRFSDDGKPAGFFYCSKEGEQCSVKNAYQADILYGADGEYNYVNSTNVMCDSQTLGNPGANNNQLCYYRKIDPNISLPPNVPYKPYVYKPPAKKSNSTYTWEIIKSTYVYRQFEKIYRNEFLIYTLIFFMVLCIIVIAYGVGKPYAR